MNAPTPAPTRPNFGQAGGQTAGDAIRRAAQAAAQSGGGLSGVTGGGGGPVTRQNLNTGVDVLSDTMGVNFNPYLRTILQQIYNTWIPLIPEEARPPLNKQGETQIRFMILPDGRIGMMHLDGSTHDDALNRAAWGSIIRSARRLRLTPPIYFPAAFISTSPTMSPRRNSIHPRTPW